MTALDYNKSSQKCGNIPSAYSVLVTYAFVDHIVVVIIFKAVVLIVSVIIIVICIVGIITMSISAINIYIYSFDNKKNYLYYLLVSR